MAGVVQIAVAALPVAASCNPDPGSDGLSWPAWVVQRGAWTIGDEATVTTVWNQRATVAEIRRLRPMVDAGGGRRQDSSLSLELK